MTSTSIAHVRNAVLAALAGLAVLCYAGLGSASAGLTRAAVRQPQVAYLVLTYDGRLLHLYVNGRLSAVAPEAGPPDPGGKDMEIGAYLSTGFWNGALDELAVYGQSLSPQRIAAHYRIGHTSSAQYPAAVKSTPGLVGYWRLDDPSRIAATVGHETSSVPRRGVVPWYGLLPGTTDRGIALNGVSAEIHVHGLPALKTFTVEVWVLPGPHVSGTTIVSRPGAWFLKTDLLGHWLAAVVHRHHVEFVSSKLVAVGPAKSAALAPGPAAAKQRLAAHKPLAVKPSSGSSSGVLTAVAVVVLIVLLGVVAASVPGRRRRRQPEADGA